MELVSSLFNRKKQKSKAHVVGKKTNSSVSNKQFADDALLFLDATTLLSSEACQKSLKGIRQVTECNEDYFDKYYMPAIETMAIYCQSFPASQGYHHSYKFGLLEHTLEVAKFALRASEKYMFNPNDNEEDIEYFKPCYQYCVFIAALLHDLSKIISDIRIEVRSSPTSHFSVWSPISSLPPPESALIEYRFQFKKTKAGKNIYDKSTHEAAAPFLAARVVPKHGWAWISSLTPHFETQLIHAITGHYGLAGEIGAALKAGDQHSTNLGADNVSGMNVQASETQDMTSVVQQGLMAILREPMSYDCTVNKSWKGEFSSIERVDDHIYFTAKKLLESLTPFVQKAGLNIPSQDNSFYNIVVDSCGVRAPSEDSLWWCKFAAKGDDEPMKTPKGGHRKHVPYLVFDALKWCPGNEIENIEASVFIAPKTLGEVQTAPKSAAEKDEASRKAIAAMSDSGITLASKEGASSTPEKKEHDTSNVKPKGKSVAATKPAKKPPQQTLLNTANLSAKKRPDKSKPHQQKVDSREQQKQNNDAKSNTPAAPSRPPQTRKEPEQKKDNSNARSNQGRGTQKQVSSRRRGIVSNLLPTESEAAHAKQSDVKPIVTNAVSETPPNIEDPNRNQTPSSTPVTDVKNVATDTEAVETKFNGPDISLATRSDKFYTTKPNEHDATIVMEMIPIFQQAIDAGTCSFNKADAIVHVLDCGIFLAAPNAFKPEFSPLGDKADTLKKVMLNSGLIQRARGDSSTIHTVVVRGAESTGRLNGFIIAVHGLTHKGKTIEPNPALTLL